MNQATECRAEFTSGAAGLQNGSGLFSTNSVLNLLKLILAGSPLPEILTMIARSVESRGDGTLCTIWLPDESCRKLYCAAAPSLPDAYTVDQFFLDRLGNDAIQLDLLYDYQSNVELYEKWHEYFRVKQPRMLIVWGINDPFFTLEGAKAYQRDIPNAELHLIDTGHFALEDSSDFIAERIKQFLKSHMPSQAPAHA